MLEQLKVLHYNIGKRKQVCWSLLNDDKLEQFHALSILEPYVYADPVDGKPSQGNHSNWSIFTPTINRAEGHIRHSYRATIWITKGPKHSRYRSTRTT